MHPGFAVAREEACHLGEEIHVAGKGHDDFTGGAVIPFENDVSTFMMTTTLSVAGAITAAHAG